MNIINHTHTHTALHLACECGSEECTTLLLSYGVDPNPVDHMSQTPLMTVCIAGHTACIHPVSAQKHHILGGKLSTLLLCLLYDSYS